MAKKNKKTKSTTSIILSIIFLFIIVAGYYVYDNYMKKNGVDAVGELSFHFMMLGNEKAGDCVYIKAGDNDILIDAGSYYDSVDDIESYVNQYVADDTLEYLIVTHAHEDHIACLAGNNSNQSLFDLYEVSTIIDFPKAKTNSGVYNRYLSKRQSEIDDGNTVHYTALECYNEENGAKRVYDLTEDGNVKLEILYNYYYDHNTSNENDNSVCVMFHHGDRQFLFTGDLEEDGEEKLAEKYDFSQVKLFKAGHHGSYTASTDALLSEIKPEICVACCCAGSVEYTDNLHNTFPAQLVINRIAKYTKKFYVSVTIDVKQRGESESGEPDYVNDGEFKILNGNIVIISEGGKEVYAKCSNNDTLLKDTDWFKENRSCPLEWR